MFLTPLNKLRKTSTKLWCLARNCSGPYEYGVINNVEVRANKPHVVLKSLRAAQQYGHQQQMPFAFMMQAQSPQDSFPYEEEEYEPED